MRHRVERSFHGSLVLVGLLALLVLALAPLAAGADRRADDDPSRTTAGELEDHEASSTDPSSHEAESGEMVESESGDPEEHVTGSEEMDAVESGDLADHEGASTDYQDLRFQAPEQGYDEIFDGRLEGVDDSSLSAPQLVAKRRLERAMAQAYAARTRYGDMIRDDYPRGEARLRIIEQRDESMSDLEQARDEFDEAMGN